MSLNYDNCCVCGCETIESASHRGNSYCNNCDPNEKKLKEEYEKKKRISNNHKDKYCLALVKKDDAESLELDIVVNGEEFITALGRLY